MTSKYGMRLGEKGTKSAGLNWAKIVDDLHTGKILGTPGKLLIDFTSGTIIALTLTGIYLWGVPMLRKRQSARQRELTQHLAPPPIRLPPGRVPTASAAAVTSTN